MGCGESEHRQEKEKMEKKVVLGLFGTVWELFGVRLQPVIAQGISALFLTLRAG